MKLAMLKDGSRDGTLLVVTSDLRRAVNAQAIAAPLPRAYQWCDGSAFLNHGRLMEKAFKTPPLPDFETIPLLYQGGSDDFLGACDDVLFVSEEYGVDFAGEYGVIVDDVPMSCTPEAAASHIKLIVQLNDWSLRSFGPREMKTGFGFFRAKPPTCRMQCRTNSRAGLGAIRIRKPFQFTRARRPATDNAQSLHVPART